MYSEELRSMGLHTVIGGDRIIWRGPTQNSVPEVNGIYQELSSLPSAPADLAIFRCIWTNSAQLKMKILLWLVVMERNLTWDILQMKGLSGPGRCCFCMVSEENHSHLFYSCSFANKVTELIYKFLNLKLPLLARTSDFISWWYKRNHYLRIIPVIYHWHMWCGRNRSIFEGERGSPERIADNIMANWESLRTPQKPLVDMSIRLRPVEIIYPASYFDSASQFSKCRCGAWLMLAPNCHFKIHWHGCFGTSMVVLELTRVQKSWPSGACYGLPHNFS